MKMPSPYRTTPWSPGKFAYALLLQTECPSWLYPVTMGATTLWERWDSMLPNGTINHGEMTSFNHYALGAVADRIHRTIGGIAPADTSARACEHDHAKIARHWPGGAQPQRIPRSCPKPSSTAPRK